MTAATAAKVVAFVQPETVRKELTKHGMGFLLRVDDASTQIRFHRIKRRSDEITGDVIVRTRIEGVKTIGNDGILHAARLNLTSTAARKKLAEILHDRTPGVPLDWMDLLEELAVGIMKALAEGDPILEVGHDPVDWSAPKYAVLPLVPLLEPGLLYGPGGSGKSMLALTCAISTAAGAQLIPGTTQMLKGPVLYLDWETNRDKINRRVVSICNGAGIAAPRGLFYRRQNRPLADDAEELSAFVAEKKVVFVVIDSAAQAIGHQGDYGDANEGALKLFEGIRMLGTVSSLIVDHVSKNELVLAGKRGRVPYGSVYKINYSRTAWEIRPGEKGGDGATRVALHDFKHNDDGDRPPIGLRMVWQEGIMSIHSDDVVEIAEGSPSHDPQKTVAEDKTLGDQILELLAGARMKGPAIAETLRANPASVRAQLNRDPRFEREGSGYWIVSREHLPI